MAFGDEGFSNLRNPKVEETLDDRISELPDEILIRILSFLQTRYAIRTCILSKRWRYLWTLLDTFTFIGRDCMKAKNSLSSFADHVFAHSVSPKLKNLVINSSYWPYGHWHEYNSQISRCLSLAVDRNVENIVLLSVDDNYFSLPECFYSCSSFISLYSDSRLNYDEVIAWKSLKSIQLENMVLEDDQIVKLLSGCPALETMELDMVEGIRRLEIKSLKLKRLDFNDYWRPSDGNDHSLEIIAPYLQHLDMSGNLYDLKCRLVDVSSVVNANLTFNITCIKDLPGEEIDDEEYNYRDYHQVFWTLVQDYLQKLSSATELTIGTWFTQVLCILQFERMPIPKVKCKNLTLELHIRKFNLYGVADLLRASPYVETLDIGMTTTRSDNCLCPFELRYLYKGDNIDLWSLISSFGLPNLKKVKIVISLKLCLLGPMKF